MGQPQLFLVRIWQDLSRFRASVRPVNDGDPQLFTEPEQVGEYFRAATAVQETQPNGERHDGEAGQQRD